MLKSNLRGTSHAWRRELARHRPQLPAHELYGGRSVSEAKKVASQLNGSLYVASAGYGLIAADKVVAPYDLSASDSEGGLHSVLAHHQATARDWWGIICIGGGLAELLENCPDAVLLAALPASYLEMVTADLMRISRPSLGRVRLFTSRAGADDLPEPLSSAVMPYDERLESVNGYSGTRADFPQRALRHFVEQLGGHLLDQDSGQTLVHGALARRKAPAVILRSRADDDQIKAMLRREWRATGGRGSVLLRYLRDHALVACEQGRFSRLWREVRAERAATEETGTNRDG